MDNYPPGTSMSYFDDDPVIEIDFKGGAIYEGEDFLTYKDWNYREEQTEEFISWLMDYEQDLVAEIIEKELQK